MSIESSSAAICALIVHPLLRDAVEPIFAERLVKRVGDVQPADVPVARPAEVIGLDVMIAHRADRRGPGDEIVLVEVPLAPIEVGVEAQLRGVALREKILAENVRDEDLLIAPRRTCSGRNRCPSRSMSKAITLYCQRLLS